jgi:hypothetical protein
MSHSYHFTSCVLSLSHSLQKMPPRSARSSSAGPTLGKPNSMPASGKGFSSPLLEEVTSAFVGASHCRDGMRWLLHQLEEIAFGIVSPPLFFDRLE